MQYETVVLVHGLWMNGMDMLLLRRRLERAGYEVKRFAYPSLKQSPPDNASDLHAYLQTIPAEVVHFVCHSLGGLVIRHLFHEFPQQRPGRVVTLGTPHRPSHAAAQLYRNAPGRALLGKSIVDGLLGNVPAWAGSHDLGSIAGDLRLGMGLLIPGIPRPCDGTVAVSETELKGMRDHVIVHASHFGLLLSREAEHHVERFLEKGSFRKD